MTITTELDAFYEDPAHWAAFRDVVTARPGSVSLRTLDWLVTNYCASHRTQTLYPLFGPASEGRKVISIFSMCEDYTAHLGRYAKRGFDPFKRGVRGPFAPSHASPAEAVTTTIGQRRFFQWAITNGVLAYAQKHSAAIEADMNSKRANPPASSSASPQLRRTPSKSPRRTPKRRGRTYAAPNTACITFVLPGDGDPVTFGAVSHSPGW